MKKYAFFIAVLLLISMGFASAEELASRPTNAVVVFIADDNEYPSILYNKGATRNLLYAIDHSFKKSADHIFISRPLTTKFYKARAGDSDPINKNLEEAFRSSQRVTPWKRLVVLKKEDLLDYGKAKNADFVTSIIVSPVTQTELRDKYSLFSAERQKVNVNVLDILQGKYIYNASIISEQGGKLYSFDNAMNYNSFPHRYAVRGAKKAITGQAPEIPVFESSHSHSIIIIADDEVLQRKGRLKKIESALPLKFPVENIYLPQKDNPKPVPLAIFDLEQGIREDSLADSLFSRKSRAQEAGEIRIETELDKQFRSDEATRELLEKFQNTSRGSALISIKAAPLNLSTNRIVAFGEATSVEKVTVIYFQEVSFRTKGTKKSGEFIYGAAMKTVDVKTGETVYEKQLLNDNGMNDEDDAFSNLLLYFNRENIK